MSTLGKLEMCILALVMVMVMVMLSCAVESPAPGEATQAEANGNTVALTDLTGSALNTARLDARNAATMGATAAGRSVLAVAVECALTGAQSIAFSVDGVSYSSTGGLGIAPGWTTGALTAAQASWVSACIFAHVNDVTKLIWISVRGTELSLSPTFSERTDYQIEEGAFWGNAFADLGPVAAYSCIGIDQAVDDTIGDLPLRQCAQWDGVTSSNRSSCGMSYAGRCSTACATSIAPYSGCSFLGGAATGPVVTIFLAGSRARYTGTP